MKNARKSKIAKACFFMSVLLVQLMVAGAAVYAAPADSTPVEVRQPDGSVINITNYGDEFFHWTVDDEGYLLAHDRDSQSWRYAYVDGDDILPGPVNAGEQQGAHARAAVQKYKADDYAELFMEIAQANRETLSVPGSTEPGTVPFVAQAPAQTDQKVLLLLIEFNNVSIQMGDRYWYDTYFNEAGTSISRYYTDMAEGRNIIDPANTDSIISSGPQNINHAGSDMSWVRSGTGVTVTNTANQGVVRVKLGMNHPIPNWNTSADAFGNVRGMITLAVKAIKDNNPSFDFSKVKTCAVIAGGEASNGFLANQTWAHQWGYDGSAVGISGQWIDYMATGEMNTQTMVTAYGIICHEFGHMLGLPDLYEGSGSGDVGPYSLMASGCHGYVPGGGSYSGTTPVALDPWSRIDLGYTSPVTVSAETYWTGDINRYDTGNYNVLKVVSSADPTQYFLIDNRAMVGYDAGLQRYLGAARKGGIMIYHINEKERGNSNANRRNVAVESADGSAIGIYVSGNNHFFSTDLFNGRTLNKFNGATSPNSNFNHSSQPYTQNVASNIKIEVLDAPGQMMTVKVGKIIDPVQDNAAIAAARTTVENAVYTVAQAGASNAAQAKAAVEAIIGRLDLNGVTASVVSGVFTAATAGTENDPDGTNGSFTFTVQLSRGAGTPVTTGDLTLTITARNTTAVSFPISIKAAKVDSALGFGTWMKGNLTTAFPPCTWTGDNSGMPALYDGMMSITEPGTYYFVLAGVSRWTYDSSCKVIEVVADADGNVAVQGYNMTGDSLSARNDSARLSYDPGDPEVLVVSWGGVPAGNIVTSLLTPY